MPDIAPSPVGQRVELDAVFPGDFALVDQRYLGARAGLLAPQPGDPGLLARQRALQRLDLADVAAVLAQRDTLVHRVLAFAGDKFNHRLVLGPVDRDRRAGGGLGALQQLQRLGVQHAGVEHEDRDVQPQRVDQVGDHHVFGAQAGSLRHRAKFGGSAAQQGHGFDQFGVKRGRGACV